MKNLNTFHFSTVYETNFKTTNNAKFAKTQNVFLYKLILISYNCTLASHLYVSGFSECSYLWLVHIC